MQALSQKVGCAGWKHGAAEAWYKCRLGVLKLSWWVHGGAQIVALLERSLHQ